MRLASAFATAATRADPAGNLQDLGLRPRALHPLLARPKLDVSQNWPDYRGQLPAASFLASGLPRPHYPDAAPFWLCSSAADAGSSPLEAIAAPKEALKVCNASNGIHQGKPNALIGSSRLCAVFSAMSYSCVAVLLPCQDLKTIHILYSFDLA